MTGIDDLYVFDGGEVVLGSNGSLVRNDGTQSRGKIDLGSLHVQDRGTFRLQTTHKDLEFNLNASDIMVSGP